MSNTGAETTTPTATPSERPRSWSVRHVTPALRTYAGASALQQLGKELARSGAQRVAIVCNPSMVSHQDAMERVRDALGTRLVATFAEAAEHSPVPVVRRAAAELEESGAQAVVVVGGGSAIVTARVATILAAEGKNVRELCTYRGDDGKLVSPRLSAAKLPQWIVPSTPTTAYAKAGAAVRDPDTGERLALFDPKVRATGVFFDPGVAATAPDSVVRSSALNALAMAIDGLQSGVDDPLAVASLRHALLLLQQWLPQVGGDVEPGEVGVRLMFASLLAGQGSDHVGTGLAQPLSHALGPRSAVGNGVVEAMMLPHTMRFNAGTTDATLADVSALLRPATTGTPATAADAVRDLLNSCQVPSKLRHVGVERNVLAQVADHVQDDWAATTVPRRADRAQLLELLETAW